MRAGERGERWEGVQTPLDLLRDLLGFSVRCVVDDASVPTVTMVTSHVGVSTWPRDGQLPAFRLASLSALSDVWVDTHRG